MIQSFTSSAPREATSVFRDGDEGLVSFSAAWYHHECLMLHRAKWG
jgi:hypothetical protein